MTQFTINPLKSSGHAVSTIFAATQIATTSKIVNYDSKKKVVAEEAFIC